MSRTPRGHAADARLACDQVLLDRDADRGAPLHPHYDRAPLRQLLPLAPPTCGRLPSRMVSPRSQGRGGVPARGGGQRRRRQPGAASRALAVPTPALLPVGLPALLHSLGQGASIHPRRFGLVPDADVRVGDPLPTKELLHLEVRAQAHGEDLLWGPGVQRQGADKAYAHAQGTVESGAAQADEDAVRDARPFRVKGAAITALAGR